MSIETRELCIFLANNKSVDNMFWIKQAMFIIQLVLPAASHAILEDNACASSQTSSASLKKIAVMLTFNEASPEKIRHSPTNL